jgi:hypothetical protein
MQAYECKEWKHMMNYKLKGTQDEPGSHQTDLSTNRCLIRHYSSLS